MNCTPNLSKHELLKLCLAQNKSTNITKDNALLCVRTFISVFKDNTFSQRMIKVIFLMSLEQSRIDMWSLVWSQVILGNQRGSEENGQDEPRVLLGLSPAEMKATERALTWPSTAQDRKAHIPLFMRGK